MVHDDGPGAWKYAGDIAMNDIVAAAKLTECDTHVAFQPQQVRQTIDARQRLGVDKYDARRVERQQT